MGQSNSGLTKNKVARVENTDAGLLGSVLEERQKTEDETCKS